MKFILALFTLSLLVITGCTNRSSSSNAPDDPDDPEYHPADNAAVIRFVKHKVVDEEGTGMVVSTYLLPEGWEVDDKFYWEYRDPTVPLRYKGLATSKDGSMKIQSFPEQGRSWSTGPGGTQGAAPPADIVEGLKFMINVERKGKKIKYLDSKVLSRTSSPNGQGATSSAQAGVVRVAYQEDGEQMEEEFYGQLYLSDVRAQTALGSTRAIVWRAKALTSFKAPKGRLGECRQIAQTVQASVRPTKKFFNTLMQVMQLLSDQYYQGIFQAGQISKLISHTNDQMLANIDATYRQTQKATDRINEQFSDYIRGVDNYTDPDGNTIKLPSGYNGAWVSDRGEYLVSNSDPTGEYKGSWTQLERGN